MKPFQLAKNAEKYAISNFIFEKSSSDIAPRHQYQGEAWPILPRPHSLGASRRSRLPRLAREPPRTSDYGSGE